MFVACMLEELRDGETVTIRTKDTDAVRRELARQGATPAEIRRVRFEGGG